jgi:16S rRNA (uracil1498-N3)-methyltransferase
MARRMFYVEEVRQGRAVLRGETAQHLRKVLRAEAGQRYEISDNRALYLAEVEESGRDSVQFRVLEELPASGPPARVWLFPALVKFDAFEWMLEKATELGVERVTPVYSARCDKGLDQASAKRLERWRRILAESGQQSRRAVRPELDPPVRLPQALAAVAPTRLWLDEQPGGEVLLDCLPAPEPLAVLLGPEGGWEAQERAAAAAAGWRAVTLGPAILRSETAAAAALAVIAAAFLQRG